ncbi:nucleotidyl transferase AbiEii/AbiGii toxin family protein [Proteiniclasticum sediminis]
MINAMQLKAVIKRIATESNISAQLVLQNYMMERFLERIAVSDYQRNIIIKGGLLIAAMVGLDTRATMDLDVTMKRISVTEQSIKTMLEDICQIKLQDDISFTIMNIHEIRAGDEYQGYRVSLTANLPPLAVPFKMDITTGDPITPHEITFDFKLLLEDRNIQVLAYNLESIIAEKIETILTRADQNTRPRDFYDVYILHQFYHHQFEANALRDAIRATAENRSSFSVIRDHQSILPVIRDSMIMKQRWSSYQQDFDYARGVSFDDVCAVIADIANRCIP